MIGRDGTGLRRVASSLALPDSPTWSPDGKQIAFSGFKGQYSAAIYIVDADGTGLARLTTPRSHIEDVAPAWSPDGTRIIFERDNFTDEQKGFPLVVMNADGTGQRVVTPKRWTHSSRHGHRTAFE